MSRAFCIASSLVLTFALGCSGAGGSTSRVGSTGTGGGSPMANGGSSVAAGGTTGAGDPLQLTLGGKTFEDGGTGGASPADQVVTKLPEGFVKTEIGGYKLGAPIDDSGGTGSLPSGGTGGGGNTAGSGGTFSSSGSGSGGGDGGGAGGAANGDCGNILLGVVRDFKGSDEGGHPDFEAKIQGANVTPNLVSTTLGTDQKPVYTSMCEIGNAMPAPICPYGAQTTSKANFDQWYRDTPGVNQAYEVSIWLQPQAGGLFTFQSLFYFPADGAGFNGMAKADDGNLHNFGFTTELHTHFLYTGGETFRFQGDDDVWVFINNKLAVDLGGLHPAQTGPVDLDAKAAELGIQKGVIYPLDLFHAERHTNQSTFRIDTNLSFVDCGTVIPGVVK